MENFRAKCKNLSKKSSGSLRHSINMFIIVISVEIISSASVSLLTQQSSNCFSKIPRNH
ncbi:hypothetical protein KFK09_013398 [Dendrobium nobile]|uniref:Uncharacterized protein n=1 Tax=Dendrobium nobile TaxID=94219 RepID=A0A8T3BA20_DENNO|nr:hypothetical protein KFK09_013398 [Dendrobium nobile]